MPKGGIYDKNSKATNKNFFRKLNIKFHSTSLKKSQKNTQGKELFPKILYSYLAFGFIVECKKKK